MDRGTEHGDDSDGECRAHPTDDDVVTLDRLGALQWLERSEQCKQLECGSITEFDQVVHR